jgi:hypothetical protein
MGRMERPRRDPGQNANKAAGPSCDEPFGQDGYPADKCLSEQLERLRPWRRRAAVEDALQRWVDGHYPEPFEGDVASVAVELAKLGTCRPILDAGDVTGVAAFMLANVESGRAPNDNDFARRIFVSVPDTTARRRRREARVAAGGSVVRGDLGALRENFRWLQYQCDLVALMRPGRTLSAARRLYQLRPRTPDMEAYPVPPVRATNRRSLRETQTAK